MESKIIWLGLAVGSTIGSLVPTLFGVSAFSMASIFWGAIGGIAGIWAGYRFTH